ncbi:hypothetical protein AAVH_14916 [Aphelenchoides avenae]|nr:hypothetical protein AAVH_14916 [Aphelenchus avenae]
MGERGLRQLCDSIDYRPRRVRIYIQVILTRCLFGCDLYRIIAHEKFTLSGVNDFASVLHQSFVKILMYDTICDELVYESANNKAIFRRRNSEQLRELIERIVKTVEILKVSKQR